MPTYIDCLSCGAQGVPNAARGLCQSCYPKITKSERERYDLEEAKEKRRKRLNGESEAATEATPDPGDGLQLEPAEPEPASGSPDEDEPFADPRGDEDPLAGFKHVPAQCRGAESSTARVDAVGKTLRFGPQVAQEFGLRPGIYAHVYTGQGRLALQLLPDYEHGAYKIWREAKNRTGHSRKLILTVQQLSRRGLVSPGQGFDVRSERGVLFLEPKEG